MAFRLPVFTKRAKRHLSSPPKFYIFDAGVFRSIRPTGPHDKPQEIDGGALEGLVAQHIRAWISCSGKLAYLYYWRTKSGNEVDFVIYGENVFCAIEVKNTANLRSKSVNSLVAFKEDYPEADVCLLYRGKERIFEKKVLCLPGEEFLKKLVPGKPIQFYLRMEAI